VVREEDAIFARELLEGDWYEGSDTAYYEDLGMLVDVWGAMVELWVAWTLTFARPRRV